MAKMSLKAARVNAGLSQIEAAKALGVSNKTLWKWEKGISLPDVIIAFELCELYGVELDSIIFLPEKTA